MDELEQRLRADAEAIRPAISDELQARIDASVQAAKDVRSVPRQPPARISTWWISSLTGLAAAAAIILILNRNSLIDEDPPVAVADLPLSSEPAQLPATDSVSGLTLRFENADLTRSLEQELVDLQADLERARKDVERDFRKAF